MDESLLQQLSVLTGIQSEDLKRTLSQWALEKGQSPKDITIDCLRDLLAHVLQGLSQEISDGYHPVFQIER